MRDTFVFPLKSQNLTCMLVHYHTSNILEVWYREVMTYLNMN
ncbi:unnamed protein product, partial [Amoebophrya sp. A120]|eukprot:GSA120T00015080001.1